MLLFIALFVGSKAMFLKELSRNNEFFMFDQLQLG
jgi:hypothetical protein